MVTTGRLHIKGELTAREDLTIDGTFEGTIDLPGHQLFTTRNSHIDAAVSARVVIVEGHVTGHITADLVDIAPSAVVQANVMTRQLALAEGGLFNGSVNTERARAAGAIARRRVREAGTA